MGEETVREALELGADAELRPQVTAALRIIERVVNDPDGPRAEDIAAARAAGVDEEGLRTAILVCVAFTMIVRLADTFDFALRSGEQWKADARMLMKRGYT